MSQSTTTFFHLTRKDPLPFIIISGDYFKENEVANEVLKLADEISGDGNGSRELGLQFINTGFEGWGIASSLDIIHSKGHSLVCVNITGSTSLTKEGMTSICNSILSNQLVKTVVFSDTQIPKQCYPDIWNLLVSESIARVRLMNLPQVGVVCKMIKTTVNTIKKLSLAKIGLKSAELSHLANCIENKKLTLETLNLQGNALEPDNLLSFFNVAKPNLKKSLKYLDLSRQHLPTSILKELDFGPDSELEALILASTAPPGDTYSPEDLLLFGSGCRNTGIRYLDFKSNRVRPEGINSLCSGLMGSESTTHLQVLLLDYNKLNYESKLTDPLMRLLTCNTLTEISLNGMKINEVGMAQIVSALSERSEVPTGINLSRNRMKQMVTLWEECVGKFVQLSLSAGLSVLRLDEMSFPSKLIPSLVDSITGSHLIELSLSGNFLRHENLCDLATANLPSLNVLKLNFAPVGHTKQSELPLSSCQKLLSSTLISTLTTLHLDSWVLPAESLFLFGQKYNTNKNFFLKFSFALESGRKIASDNLGDMVKISTLKGVFDHFDIFSDKEDLQSTLNFANVDLSESYICETVAYFIATVHSNAQVVDLCNCKLTESGINKLSVIFKDLQINSVNFCNNSETCGVGGLRAIIRLAGSCNRYLQNLQFHIGKDRVLLRNSKEISKLSELADETDITHERVLSHVFETDNDFQTYGIATCASNTSTFLSDTAINSFMSAPVDDTNQSFSIRYTSCVDEKTHTAYYSQSNILGQGTYGTVFKGIMDSGENIAVKRISVSTERPSDLEKVVSEARLMEQLRSPFIVGFLGIVHQHNEVLILMEVMEETLAQKVQAFGTNAVPDNFIFLWGGNILQGLRYLHSSGYVHSDLKPQNILLKGATCKLSDFGCSRSLEQLSSADRILGTPAYMAPESLVKDCERLNDDTFKIDIWSLGCTLLELHTRTRPWSTHQFSNPLLMMQFIKQTKLPPSIPSSVSEELKTVLDSCLVIDPTVRASVDELLELDYFTKRATS